MGFVGLGDPSCGHWEVLDIQGEITVRSADGNAGSHDVPHSVRSGCIELVLSQHPTWSIDEATLVASIPPPTPTHPHDIQWIRSLAFSHIFCGKREGMKNAS